MWTMICFTRSAVLGRYILNRCFHTTQIRRIDPKTVEEIKIPVPWGHIAGKWWRKNEEQPVLALHGLFDNAATFDELVPLLNENISFLALDLPGFGRSSNPPAGMNPSYYEMIIWIRYIIKHYFKWEKVNFLSHSFGSNLSFAYTGTFPEEVNKFVSIDCSRFNMASRPEYLLDDLRKGYMGGVLKNLNIPYEGSYKTFVDWMMENRKNFGFPLTEKSCNILLSRDLEKIGEDHYRMITDRKPYVKYMGRPTIGYLDALAERVKCEMLVIRATKGVFVDHRLELLEKQLDVISKNSTRLVYGVIEGGHHMHLEQPERVAAIINKFL